MDIELTKKTHLVLASQWYKNQFVAICKVPIPLIVNLNYLFKKEFCDNKKNTFLRMEA